METLCLVYAFSALLQRKTAYTANAKKTYLKRVPSAPP